MTNEELVRAALEKVGGKSNVLTATNCMTRLRVRVKDDAKVDDEGLKAIEGVMGIVHAVSYTHLTLPTICSV